MNNPIVPIFRLASLTLLVLILSFSKLFAQTATIKGKVTDTQQNPLANINIALAGTHYGAATKSDGTYKFSSIPAGDYTFVVSGVGYQTQKKEITLQKRGRP